jgi:drug/metabolite transporter (DMT)-like permease
VVFGPEALKGGGSNYLTCDLLMLFGVFNSSVYIVLSRSMIDKFGAMFVTTAAMLFGTLFLALLAWLSGELGTLPVIGRDEWMALLFLGVIAGAVQFFLFVWALGLLPPTRASIYLVLTPVSAIVLSILFLDEVLAGTLLAGLALIVFGIYVNNYDSARKS